MMSYNFVDTTEARFSEQLLPTEALQFNGVWLDQAIPGFRTLTVAGRESVESEIKTNSVDARDGADYQYARYLPRTIIVAFQLGARDSYEFRALFNALNRLLLKRQGQIVFADEPDKYYVGTMTNISDVPPGRNAVTGEIEFYCADPIKYSLEETVISSNTFKSLEFTYQGTYPVYPILSAVMAQDCGYVTFFHHASTPEIFDENGKLVIVTPGADASIMIGNPEEIDGQLYDVYEDLIKITAFSVNELNNWSKNTDVPMVTSKYSVGGNVGVTSITEYVDSSAKRVSVASATDYEMAREDGVVWHGPTMTRAIPSDSNGDNGALNFSLEFQNYFFSDDAKELGIFQLNIYGTSSSAIQGTKKCHVAGITFYRDGAGSGNVKGHFSVNGAVVKTFSFAMSRQNCFTGFDSRCISIFKRMNDTIIFEMPTEKRAGWERFGFMSDALGKVRATEISVFFGKCGSASAMQTNALRSLKFSTYIEKTIDEPNLFSKGDMITADCSTGTIYVNGQQRDDLGNIDNNWEDFCIRPGGTDSVSAACSSWVKENPEYIVRFREAYL
ncbi:distal tail protein Dit [Butyricicoccus sp.]|uniref:distal tail protein Dit n=1 Tax=Butyricicoccus sp. TaxID=2049021 RepID=UPI003D7C8B7D